MFALPKELHDEGVRRYGFHGLSYEYIASTLPQLDPAAANGPHRGLPPGQRRQHVRSVRRAQRGQHDGLHRGRRTADGHALRRARSGRDPVPDGPARHGCARHRKADLQPVGAARRVRRVQRHAHAAGQRRRRAPSWRWTCSSTASLASSARWRRRWAGWTRSSSPAASARTAPSIRERVCRDAAWLGVQLDAAANRAAGPRISTAVEPHCRVGAAHQRRADDRPTHAPRAGLNAACTRSSER